jgi:hypothetical protein
MAKFRSAQKEWLFKYNQSKSQKVEVLNLLTNEITVHSSNVSAGEYIGCSEGNIRRALNQIKEKGVGGLIKGKYRVITEDLKHLKLSFSNNSKGNPPKVEVLNTLTNEITVHPSICEASVFIGCTDANVRSALKYLKDKGISRLIKKIYKVKLYTKD